MFGDPAAQGGGFEILVRGDVEPVAEIVHVHAAVRAVEVFADLLDFHFLFVMFVQDFADQFLQNIFHGDHAAGAAVFVYHDGNVGLFGLQLAQDAVDAFALGDVDDRRQKRAQGLLRNAVRAVKVLEVNDTDHIVDVLVIDGQTGKMRFGKGLRKLLPGAVDGDCLHGGAVDHDVLGALFGEGDHVA